MTNKISRLIFFLFVFSTFCGEAKDVKGRQIKKSSVETQLPSDPATTVKRFFKWYKVHRDQLRKINVIDGIPGDKTQPYKINKTNLDKYLTELKKSNLLSDIYLYNLRQKYINVGLSLEQSPQFDGPIDELEYDIIYGIMEEEDITNHLNDMEVKSKITHHNKSFVLFKMNNDFKIKAYLTKHNNIWLIEHCQSFYSKRV